MLPPPYPYHALPDLELFHKLIEGARYIVAIKQARLAAFVDQLGPAGIFEADPHAGTLVLRGHTFGAEMLGSFDGRNWLWAWGNPMLALPAERTAVGRAASANARDLSAAALAWPFLDLEGRMHPHDLASLAMVIGGADAVYMCPTGHSEVYYAIARGQLRPHATPLEALHDAMRAVSCSESLRAVQHACKWLGVEVTEQPGVIVAKHGGETLTVAHDGHRITTVRMTMRQQPIEVVNVERTPWAPTGGGDGWTELDPSAPLAPALAAVAQQASTAGKKPFALMHASWAPPCAKLKAARSDPKMRAALAGAHVIEIDIDHVTPAQIAALGLNANAIPSLFRLDASGHATGVSITSGAWGEDTPDHIAPVLAAFIARA